MESLNRRFGESRPPQQPSPVPPYTAPGPSAPSHYTLTGYHPWQPGHQPLQPLPRSDRPPQKPSPAPPFELPPYTAFGPPSYAASDSYAPSRNTQPEFHPWQPEHRPSSYVLLKTSSWDVLECTQKENLIVDCDRVEEGFDDSTKKIRDSSAGFCGVEKVDIDGNSEADGDYAKHFDEAKSVEAGEDDVARKRETVEEEKSILIMKDKSVQVCVEEDEVPPQHLEYFLDYSGHTLVPIELVDSMADEHLGEGNDRIEDDGENKGQDRVDEKESLVLGREEKRADAFLDVDINEEPTYIHDA